MAARIQTRAQASATGRMPSDAYNMISPFHGLITRAHTRGKRIEATIPALNFMVEGRVEFLTVSFGAGLNILGRIRMPQIKKMSTSISLIPVNGFSLC